MKKELLKSAEIPLHFFGFEMCHSDPGGGIHQ